MLNLLMIFALLGRPLCERPNFCVFQDSTSCFDIRGSCYPGDLVSFRACEPRPVTVLEWGSGLTWQEDFRGRCIPMREYCPVCGTEGVGIVLSISEPHPARGVYVCGETGWRTLSCLQSEPELKANAYRCPQDGLIWVKP
jgi:hypothetical protein